jgi:transcriptional regulator with XRE-family HTH domain
MYPGLKKLREERGITQAQAAALVKVHPNTWALWERGEQNPSGCARQLIEMVIKFVPVREIIALNSAKPIKEKKPTARRSRSGLSSLNVHASDFALDDSLFPNIQIEGAKPPRDDFFLKTGRNG